MSDRKLVKLAKDYCYNYHEGQLRKGTKLPYHTHPIAVAEILDEFGYTDATTKCIALLHDVIEDSPVITGEIKEKFGYEIANGVYILSKNTINKEIIKQLDNSSQIDIKKLSPDQVYKFRLSFARKKVKMVLTGDGGDEVLSGYNTYLGLKLNDYYLKFPSFFRYVHPTPSTKFI